MSFIVGTNIDTESLHVEPGRIERMRGGSSNLAAAPKETQVLMRHSEWECPAVVKFTEEYSPLGEWVFCETALAEVDGAIIDLEGCEWAPLPA